MSEQMQQDGLGAPTPLAVPWTPPAQAAAPSQPHQAPQAQMAATPMPMAQPQAYSPAPQPAHQPYSPMAQAGLPSHAPAQPYMQAQPQPQTGYAPAQNAHLQMAQMAPQHRPQNFPPMPMEEPSAAPEATESKSLFAKLAKRKPKAAHGGTQDKRGGSLFDKNFVFGLAAGLVLGFLVLPMVFGGSAEPAQSYTPTAQLTTPQPTAPIVVQGEPFVDVALAEEVP